LQRDGRFLGKTSPERIHSRDQFLHCERLREVIIRAESETRHPIAYFSPRGQDKDTGVDFRRAQMSQHFESIHPWQHHIEHEKIVPLQVRFPQGGLTIVDHDRLVARFSEGAADMLGKSNFIFDD
jgi:hypothetical protein